MSRTSKLNALKAGDRAALTIDTNDPPPQALSIRGVADVDEVDGVVPEYALAAERYLGEEQGRAYIASLSPDVKMA